MLPFTPDQFHAVFRSYNEAIWPAQILAYLLGAIALLLLVREDERSDRTIAALLAAMWAWTGLAYHLAFFVAINRLAYAFSALFLLQAALLAHAAVFHHRIRFGVRRNLRAFIGAAFVIYAAGLYPLIGIAAGHGYPALPMFGVTPCPVTIFTLGMLLLTRRPPPVFLFVVPVLWSLVGGSAAILLGVPQDWLLLASGAVAVVLDLASRRDFRSETGQRT